jgi:hypothetical protein
MFSSTRAHSTLSFYKKDITRKCILGHYSLIFLKLVAIFGISKNINVVKYKVNISTRRVKIVYRGLGRAFVVHKNRDLEGNSVN